MHLAEEETSRRPTDIQFTAGARQWHLATAAATHQPGRLGCQRRVLANKAGDQLPISPYISCINTVHTIYIVYVFSSSLAKQRNTWLSTLLVGLIIPIFFFFFPSFPACYTEMLSVWIFWALNWRSADKKRFRSLLTGRWWWMHTRSSTLTTRPKFPTILGRKIFIMVAPFFSCSFPFFLFYLILQPVIII